MRIVQNGDTLNVSGIEQLAACNSTDFRSAVRAALPANVTQINIDLAHATLVDCSGVGVLIALRNSACQLNSQATVRIANPSPSARRILQLTCLDKIFINNPLETSSKVHQALLPAMETAEQKLESGEIPTVPALLAKPMLDRPMDTL